MKQIENEFSKKFDEIVKRQKIEAMNMLREQLGCISNHTFCSTMVIDEIIKSIDLHGHVTSKVYAMYYDLCKKNDVKDIMSNIQFSLYVCKWYGYHCADKKHKGKKVRVFCRTDNSDGAGQGGSGLIINDEPLK